MAGCSKCNGNAVTFIRYSGRHLCKWHFMEFVEGRVKREIRTQGKMRDGTTIAIALSGGKDSVVAMDLLWKVFGENRGIGLEAITVDEGIDGYRPSSIGIARKAAEERGIGHHVVTFRESFGTTMDQICSESTELTPCAYCGVLRRQCLNLKAKELGASHLATGLNLDDTAQSILMNFVRGDVEKLARLGPHCKVQEGLVPRMQPLRSIPEKESYLYAMLSNIDIHDQVCLYSERALRGRYRDLINRLEQETPGTRHSIVRSLDQLKPVLDQLYMPAHLVGCDRCGEPTVSETCKACQMVESVSGGDRA